VEIIPTSKAPADIIDIIALIIHRARLNCYLEIIKTANKTTTVGIQIYEQGNIRENIATATRG
jgi:hypothetical protein